MNFSIKKWVLLAEDEDAVRKSIRDALLDKFGKEIKIVEARDGAEAETKIKNQTFHLIITDIRMPRKDGEDLISSLREGGFNQTTPVIAISAYASNEIEKKFPFVAFLEKPLDMEKLAKQVRVYFKLGTTKKMVEASIFSSLLDCSIKFLSEAMKRDDFKVGELKFKKTGEEVVAEHAAVIQVMVGQVSNTFSILCSKKTLEELKDNSENIAGSSVEVICRSLGYVILKHVLTECGIIDSNEVKVENISEDPTQLTNKQGLLIPINALNVDYKVFATNTKSKKAA